MTAEVFISYSRAGSLEEARALRDALEAQQIRVFLDERAIAPGDQFPDDIADALIAARVFVVLADEYYFTRPWCVYEFQVAVSPYRVNQASTGHIAVALAQNEHSSDILSHLPPPLAKISWPAITQTDALTNLVVEKLQVQSDALSVLLEGLDDEIVANLRKGGAIPLPGERAGMHGYLKQLPVTLKNQFVGRDGELWQLFHLLETRRSEGGALSCLVQGGAGMGKTQLVAEYLWRYGQRHYAGGMIWVDADVDRQGLISQFYEVLQIYSPNCGSLESLGNNEEEQYRTVSALLQNVFNQLDQSRRLLWVVDNIPEPVKGSPPQAIDFWCPVRQRVVLLATSRRAGVKGFDNLLPLGELSVGAAVELITRPQVKQEWLNNDEWSKIAKWVGCLPLALIPLHESLSDGFIDAKSMLQKAEGVEPAVAVDEEVDALREDIAPEYLRGVAEALHISYGNLATSAELLNAAHLVAWLSPLPIPDEPLRDLVGMRSPAQLSKRGWLQEAESSAGQQIRSWRMHRVYASFLRVHSVDTDTELASIAIWLRQFYTKSHVEEIKRAIAAHRNIACDHFFRWCNQQGDQSIQTCDATRDLAISMASWQLEDNDLRGQRYVGGQLAFSFNVDEPLIEILTQAYDAGNEDVAINIATLLHVLSNSEHAAGLYLKMLEDSREEVRRQVLVHATEHGRTDLLALPLLQAIMSESDGKAHNMRVDPRYTILMGAEKLVTISMSEDGVPARSGGSGDGIVGFEKMLPPQAQLTATLLARLMLYDQDDNNGQRGAVINIIGRVLGFYGKQYEAGEFDYDSLVALLTDCALNDAEHEIAMAAAQYLGWMDDDSASAAFNHSLSSYQEQSKRLRAIEVLGTFMSFAEAPLSTEFRQHYEDGVSSYSMDWGKGRRPKSEHARGLVSIILNQGEDDDMHEHALNAVLSSRAGKKALIEAFTELFDAGSFQQAIALADTMQRSGSTMQSLYWWRGQAYQELGQAEEARADYDILLADQSVEGCLYHALVHKQIGDLYATQGDYANAMEYFDQSITLDSRDDQTYVSRALAFENLGRDDEALADYTKAIELAPGEAYAYLCRGIVSGRLGDAENAIIDYEKALSVEPDYIDVYFYRGNEYYYQRNHQAAVQDLKTYVTACPGAVGAYHVLAGCLIALKQYRETIDAENKAIELSPNIAEYYYIRGAAYHYLGEYKAAYDDMKVSLELNPDDERVRQLHHELFKKLTRI